MIRIVTDSDANLPEEVVDEYGIEVAPIHLVFGDEVLREGIDLTHAEAYERMSAAPELPKTSQPPVGEFTAIYQRVLSQEPGATILSIHISLALSGTLTSARQAADLLRDEGSQADFHFFDTRSASLGQGLMVRQAAEMARRGATVGQIMERLEHMRDHMHLYFVLETVDYLAKGGRIGRAAHLVSNLFEIRPILWVNDGVIDAYARHRTWKRAVQGLQDLVARNIEEAPRGGLQMGVAHGVSEAAARELAADLCDRYTPEVFLLSQVGPGLGVHTGPGALGVCWYLPGEP